MHQNGAESVSSVARRSDPSLTKALSVVLISPAPERHRSVVGTASGPVKATIVHELTTYPSAEGLAKLARIDHDVLLVDVDPDPERALEVVEHACHASGSVTVMVLSSRADQTLLVRCMRAGAREFLTEPVPPNLLGEAFGRASARRQEVRIQKRTQGKILIFVGAKGGSGATTVSTNFAVALAKASGEKVALVDLHLQLGDVALTLGITPQFSVSDALENVHRLDSDFLSTLLANSAGVSVLAAPDKVYDSHPSVDSIEKLLHVMQEDFPYVVIDAGPSLSSMYGKLFELADVVYLITQVNLPELRNANRLITSYFKGARRGKLEVILNRFIPQNLEVDEESINRALTCNARWKLPNEFAAMRRAQNAGSPIALEDTGVSRSLLQMANAVCGAQAAQPEKKRRFSLFR